MKSAPRRSFAPLAALAAAGLLLAAGQSPAADATSGGLTLLAERFTWGGFVDYWAGWANSKGRVVQIVTIVGFIAILLICTGKWKK